MNFPHYTLLLTLLVLVTFSCQDDDNSNENPGPSISMDDPANFVFVRDGDLTVSFSGQTERADMLAAIKGYLTLGDTGEPIEVGVLRAAITNEGDNGGGLFDFTSTKQLEDKLFGPDIDEDYFGNLFEQAAIASESGQDASNGIPGLILRESKGSTILVNNLGQEFTQFIEKGLMGSVFLNQIYNTYLTDDRTGDAVDNITIVEGKNYTDLEHHWDEAFGYFQAPGDFKSDWPEARESEVRFWSNYANIVDPVLGINDNIMNAFRAGRTAIVANDNPTKNASRATLYTELEILAAATTIHYINLSLDNLNAGDTGEFLHTLSEAYMFARALLLSPNRVISRSELFNILNKDFGNGGNFWLANATGLNTAKDKLVATYPSLAAVKDQL